MDNKVDLELIKAEYKNMSNLVILKGSWTDEENTYNNKIELQIIDKVVGIIVENTISYIESLEKSIYDSSEYFETYIGYLKIDDKIFKLEKIYGQGCLCGIKYEKEGSIKDGFTLANIEDVIAWMEI